MQQQFQVFQNILVDWLKKIRVSGSEKEPKTGV